VNETDVTNEVTGERPLDPPRRGREVFYPVLHVVAVLAAYVVVGAAAGWLWYKLWTPAEGTVVGHIWFADGDALRGAFSGTGLYVLVAAAAGFGVGLVCAFLGGRRPVLTLVAALAGSVLAAWLMLKIGQDLGPADPQELARTARDQSRLPSALRVSGLSPRLAFPGGTLAALALVFLVFPGNSREASSRGEPRG
jgi:hypothetical protein